MLACVHAHSQVCVPVCVFATHSERQPCTSPQFELRSLHFSQTATHNKQSAARASGEVSGPRSLADCFSRLAKARTWTEHWALPCMAPHDWQLEFTGQVILTTQPSREHPDSLAALVYDRAQDEHRL